MGGLSNNAWRWVADGVLIAHVGVAVFLVAGQIAIMWGGLTRSGWVRDPVFRVGHLALMAFIAGEAWLGVTCPLTTLEMALREWAHQPAWDISTAEAWLRPVLFFSAPHWAFMAAHTTAVFAIVATLVAVPPDGRRHAWGSSSLAALVPGCANPIERTRVSAQ